MDQGYQIRHVGNYKGIGLFATKCYKKGEIIFEEKPLVCAQFAWNEVYNYSACHHCLRPLELTEENVRRLTGNKTLVLPFPELCPTDKTKHTVCDECGVTFCCEECKEASMVQYHRLLCTAHHPDLLTLIDTWKSLHHPPESTTIMLLARIVASIESSPDKEAALSTLLQFNHNLSSGCGDIVGKMVGAKGLKNMQLLSQIMPQVIPASEYSQSLLTEDGIKTLFALVGRNGQGIGTSVFSQWVKNTEAASMPKDQKSTLDNFIDTVYEDMDKNVGEFLNCEGSGLYSTQRCINHSCEPNAEVTFPNSDSTLVLVAKQDIAAGEEICSSYLDDCVLARSRHSRNKLLRDYYLFECSCLLCLSQADDADETSEDEDSDEFEDCIE